MTAALTPLTTPCLEYDTETLVPWSCARCHTRVATHRLRGRMDGGPTDYCQPCGQQVLHTVTQEAPPRPWTRLITETLLDNAGPYVDYVAWEHWMLAHGYELLLDPLGTVDRTTLYALCCDLWERTL